MAIPWRPTLAQIMACCLTAPDINVNLSSMSFWHSQENNFPNTSNINLYAVYENCTFDICQGSTSQQTARDVWNRPHASETGVTWNAAHRPYANDSGGNRTRLLNKTLLLNNSQLSKMKNNKLTMVECICMVATHIETQCLNNTVHVSTMV